MAPNRLLHGIPCTPAFDGQRSEPVSGAGSSFFRKRRKRIESHLQERTVHLCRHRYPFHRRTSGNDTGTCRRTEDRRSGGIAVNDYLQTSDESIYAIGDAIEFRHPITGKRGSITLLVPPIVRDELSQTTFREHTSLMKEPSELPLQKYFDMTVASTGLPGKTIAAGRNQLYVFDHPSVLSRRILPGCHADEY